MRSPRAALAPKSCPIATAPRGGKSHQQRPLADACRVAKLSLAASFHTLRHTYASLLVMDAVPLKVVAGNLGHADTRLVERHYGHLATSYVRKAIRAAKPLRIGDAAKVVPIASAWWPRC